MHGMRACAGAVRGIAVAPSGEAAVSCSVDCSVRLFRLPFAPFASPGPVEDEAGAVLEFQGKHAFRAIDHHWTRDTFGTAGAQVTPTLPFTFTFPSLCLPGSWTLHSAARASTCSCAAIWRKLLRFRGTIMIPSSSMRVQPFGATNRMVEHPRVRSSMHVLPCLPRMRMHVQHAELPSAICAPSLPCLFPAIHVPHRASAAPAQVDIWDHARSEPVASYAWGADAVTALRFNPAEPDVLASAGSDRSIALYDLRSGTPIRKIVMQACAWGVTPCCMLLRVTGVVVWHM
jgi:hypothetical protein